MGGKRRNGRVRVLGLLVAVPLMVAGLAACHPTGPGGGHGPQPLDLSRPRILGAGANLRVVAARLDREPYRTVFGRLVAGGDEANGIALDDHTIGSERTKTQSAKDLAFEYALNRTEVGGVPAPFPTTAARQAVGDRTRDLLLNMYTRSRLAVPAPLGGSDRDINSSEELLQYATAYDSLVGAHYTFGDSEPTIRKNITDLAAELYDDYLHPSLVGGATSVLPNNHRSKSAAALGIAALALLDSAPPQGAPPADVRSPAAWLNFALDQVDVVEGWTFTAADGAYGEGPFYQRYAAQNLLPFAKAWNHANHGQTWDVGGHVITDLWTSPRYRATQQWVFDMTLPNGSLAPIDDSNVDFSYYFGAAPTTPANAAEFAWRWANAPTPYDADGNVDLAGDSLVTYDDSVVPAPPTGSPTRFYPEGGDAVFRSDWTPDATTAVVLGEHGAAMELGRDRNGLGQLAGAAHEQPDTGSFLLDAFGEPMLLDPGYLTFETRSLVAKATDHNLILVNGAGPKDPAVASVVWFSNLAGPPPVDGQATITGTRDTPFLDTARVTTAYATAKVDRRFFFVDDRYIVVADTLQAAAGQTPTYSWLLHGNGGGTSGGTYATTASGGEWVQGPARLDAAVATDAGPVSLSTRDSNHEGTGRVLLTHTALTASSTATGPTTRGLLVAYPSRSGEAAPTVETLPPSAEGAAVRITDTAGDRIVVATHHPDGTVSIRDTHLDGTPRVDYSDATKTAGNGHGAKISTSAAGPLGLRVSPTSADVLSAGPSEWVRAERLPFIPERADGACRVVRSAQAVLVQPGGDGAVTLRAGRGNSAPAADAGPDRDGVTVGSRTRLAGRGCDLDRDRLTPHWELVAAPSGSAWSLANPNSWSPTLSVDEPGPFHARLTVTDGRGGTSRTSDVEIYGGPRCTGDRLSWNDPRCG